MKLRRRGSRVETIGLVDHKMNSFAGAPQALGDVLVGGCQTVSRIHQEQNRIGFFDSDQDLADDQGFDAFLLIAQSTGVHHKTRPIFQLGPPVLPVSCQTGLICDQRVPRSSQYIEEGGLADVRSADESNDGQRRKQR